MQVYNSKTEMYVSPMEEEDTYKFLAESSWIEGHDFPIEAYIARYEEIRGFSRKDPTYSIYNLHIVNSITALYYIFDRINSNLTFDMYSLMSVHRMQMRGLLPSAGSVRNIQVYVGTHVPPKAEMLDYYLTEFLERLNAEADTPLNLHYEFESIHPFVDGNGRVGRLLWAWDVLRRGGDIKPILNSFIGDTPSVRRSNYYKALEDFRK